MQGKCYKSRTYVNHNKRTDEYNKNMAYNERKDGKNEKSDDPLSNEELARLLNSEIQNSERYELLKKLCKDPISVEILALAVSIDQVTSGGLSKDTIEKILHIVSGSGTSF